LPLPSENVDVSARVPSLELKFTPVHMKQIKFVPLGTLFALVMFEVPGFAITLSNVFGAVVHVAKESCMTVVTEVAPTIFALLVGLMTQLIGCEPWGQASPT
jgi:hypothetical protein